MTGISEAKLKAFQGLINIQPDLSVDAALDELAGRTIRQVAEDVKILFKK